VIVVNHLLVQAAADTVVQEDLMEVVDLDHVLDHVPQEVQALNGRGMVALVVHTVAEAVVADI
jgi:hypothetical protein